MLFSLTVIYLPFILNTGQRLIWVISLFLCNSWADVLELSITNCTLQHCQSRIFTEDLLEKWKLHFQVTALKMYSYMTLCFMFVINFTCWNFMKFKILVHRTFWILHQVSVHSPSLKSVWYARATFIYILMKINYVQTCLTVRWNLKGNLTCQ